MTRISALLTVIALFVAAPVAASPTFQYGTAATYPISLETGRGLPAAISHEAIAIFPVAPGWSVPVAAGFGTGLDAFQPAPHIQLGLGHKIADRAAWGVTGLYRYQPGWQPGVPRFSLVALTTGPVIFVTEGVTLILPVGVGYNLSLDSLSASFTSKLTFTIP